MRGRVSVEADVVVKCVAAVAHVPHLAEDGAVGSGSGSGSGSGLGLGLGDRKSTRLNSSHCDLSRMPSSA